MIWCFLTGAFVGVFSIIAGFVLMLRYQDKRQATLLSNVFMSAINKELANRQKDFN